MWLSAQIWARAQMLPPSASGVQWASPSVRGLGALGTRGNKAFVPAIKESHFPRIWGLGQGDW